MTFLIERTGARIACLLNPESLEARRSAGIARRRHASGGVLGNPRSDDPLISTGGGITEYDVQLLFDVEVANEGRPQRAPETPLQNLPPVTTLPTDAVPETAPAEDAPATDPPAPDPAGEPEPEPVPGAALEDDPAAADTPAAAPAAEVPPATPAPAPVLASPPDPSLVVDVRELTQPLWALAESGEPVDGALVPQRIRFIWGKSWNVPGVILAVAERLERFDANGVPQRSWLSMRMRRVEEEGEGSGSTPPRQPTTPQFQIDPSGADGSYAGQDVITLPVDGDGFAMLRHDQIGAEFYGDPAMGRAVFEANDRDDLLGAREGDRLRLPPRAAVQMVA